MINGAAYGSAESQRQRPDTGIRYCLQHRPPFAAVHMKMPLFMASYLWWQNMRKTWGKHEKKHETLGWLRQAQHLLAVWMFLSRRLRAMPISVPWKLRRARGRMKIPREWHVQCSQYLEPCQVHRYTSILLYMSIYIVQILNMPSTSSWRPVWSS